MRGRRRRHRDGGDDDFLDGMCDLDFDNGPPVSDEHLPYVVLFASHLDGDLQVRDRGALLAKAKVWRALFGGGD